ncbi:MAG TPA: SpoIIE family protein phosphatase, partial [Nevskia sp.]|nr:SpoIIE family protein phosphatase [Nevskia sp.]
METPAAKTGAAAAAPDGHALKVLVVDDTATNRQILRVFLSKLGYRVELAEDGAQAVEQFTAWNPDIVLMDVMMPVMDGYEAARIIKKICGDRWVPIVFVSALDKEENLVMGLDAGGDDYLHKPVSFVVLHAKLRSLERSIRTQQALEENRKQLRENAMRLQRYHDAQEEENTLAQHIIERQMSRPGLADTSVRHWIAPAANFSGDIIAVARAPDHRLYVLLADATGHGLAAAISVLPVLTMFYDFVERGYPLDYIVTELNRQLCTTMPSGRFVAASLLWLDEETGRAHLWQGGMPDILLLDAQGAVKARFPAQQLPLGIVEFDEEAAVIPDIKLQPGEQFALFSDGLIEAADAAGVQFGMGRLCEALA